jgi:Tol biopolymer transport system component
MLEEGGRVFDIFMVNTDGSGLEQITHSGTFDAFPMFSFDGTKLAFSSNRNATRTPTRDTNVFVADWVEAPDEASTPPSAGE